MPQNDEVVQLRAKLERGDSGTATLSRPAAAALGLGARLAIAGFSPIRGTRATIAVATSARRMRDRGRLGAWRLAAATAMAGLLATLFGVIASRQRRRVDRLADALARAEETAALRERAEQLVDVIPLGVLSLDRVGRVTGVNPYLAERGVRAGGDLAAALPAASDAERAVLRALVDEAADKRDPVEKVRLELHFVAGQRREVDAYAIPLRRPLPDVERFLVLHDRTELHALERKLVQAEKLSTIGTLAAGVAHEIGTPLGIISGRAEQLLAKADEATQKPLRSILDQVDKVSATIRQLLDFSRMRPVDAAMVTPTEALEHVASLLDHRFKKAKVALEVDAPATVPAVVADPGQLEQVLVNLLMNACDACAPGGHVQVRAHARDEQIALEVRDDGSGIAPEHLPHVLDPFFTTKKRGQGTGLGLTIAADIVKNHGGRLELESVVGEGTTIRVLLPRAAEAHA
jgi:signal transduction histidine kinase